MFPSARPPHQPSRNARRTPVRSPGRALAAKRRSAGGPQPSRRCPLWRRGRCLWRCVRSTAGIRTATAAIRGAVAAAPCRGCPAADPSHRAHPLLSPGPALGALVALWWFGGAEAAIPPVLELKAPIVPRSCLLWCGAGGRACTRSRVSLCSDNGTFSHSPCSGTGDNGAKERRRHLLWYFSSELWRNAIEAQQGCPPRWAQAWGSTVCMEAVPVRGSVGLVETSASPGLHTNTAGPQLALMVTALIYGAVCLPHIERVPIQCSTAMSASHSADSVLPHHRSERCCKLFGVAITQCVSLQLSRFAIPAGELTETQRMWVCSADVPEKPDNPHSTHSIKIAPEHSDVPLC